MNNSRLLSSAFGAVLAIATIGQTQTPAKADTASTVAIAAGAAAIVGALVYDGSNHPYYVRNNHRYYVTQNEAAYYRGHHHGVMRNAYVPEQQYSVKRDPYHGGGNHGGGGHDQGHNHH